MLSLGEWAHTEDTRMKYSIIFKYFPRFISSYLPKAVVRQIRRAVALRSDLRDPQIGRAAIRKESILQIFALLVRQLPKSQKELILGNANRSPSLIVYTHNAVGPQRGKSIRITTQLT